MALESSFRASFTAALALKEKQIQQNYRPVIGVHKWFARRPGTLFRNLLLAEFDAAEGLERSFFRSHRFRGVIADPFMGGGTPLIEANRLGFHVIGADVNPMAFWVVRQELASLDLEEFTAAAECVVRAVDDKVHSYYSTTCTHCGESARVKYFLWVKTQDCPQCGTSNDLFPGYLLAEATRHPKHVLACSECGDLVELDYQPRASSPGACPTCGGRVQIDGPARRNVVHCRRCRIPFRYPPSAPPHAPTHRLWAMEYHCYRCKDGHAGRFFKKPDAADLDRVADACRRYGEASDLPIPNETIPDGDETRRLHKWGYQQYRQMFNPRQLLGLGTLFLEIAATAETSVRHALFTVFSDTLRYQNMLCRYDTYALKCQDIFSVHGFPVGLVQCENNLLGMPRIGSGGFRHFIEKYARAKSYCEAPFETTHYAGRKQQVQIAGERIAAEFSRQIPSGTTPQAMLTCVPAGQLTLPAACLDGVFTDPPYFDNVQYAELMDFCYVWLRRGLSRELREFELPSTRTPDELTGNETMGRGLEHFTDGLSEVFRRFADALKPGAPFVFTYHHNSLDAYAPLVVALLDARLLCNVVLPAPAEMEASLHINNTKSSILDSVFVSRRRDPPATPLPLVEEFESMLEENCRSMRNGGVTLTIGDIRCLLSGQLARLCLHYLYNAWDSKAEVPQRLKRVREALKMLGSAYSPGDLAADVLEKVKGEAADQLRLFDAEASGA